MAKFAAAIVLALAFCLSGCQSARMARPDGLGPGAAEWQVQGRAGFNFDGDFAFGPYRAADVRRGWKKTTRIGLITGNASYSAGWAREQYEFTLRRDGSPRAWVAQCAVGMDWKQADLDRFLGGRLEMTFRPETTLAAVFDCGANVPPWRLVAGRRGGEMVLSGCLSDGGQVLEVQGSRALEGTPIALTDASGYVFLRGGKVAGAVDVVNDGRVWADQALDENVRDALCAASAALLLYRELK